MYIVSSLLIMAGVTYLIRVLPMTLFTREIKSRYIKSFLYYVPYAVLGAMTFPHIIHETNNPVNAAFGMITAVVLSYMGKSLNFVAVASVLVVYVCNLINF